MRVKTNNISIFDVSDLAYRRYPHIRVFYSNQTGEWREEINYDSQYRTVRRCDLFGCR